MRAPRSKSGGLAGRVFALWAAGLTVSALFLGLGLVWCNIERMDLGYELKAMQDRLEGARSLTAKLQVERDNMLAPHRLRARAKALGLGPDVEGRTRRMEDGQ